MAALLLGLVSRIGLPRCSGVIVQQSWGSHPPPMNRQRGVTWNPQQQQQQWSPTPTCLCSAAQSRDSSSSSATSDNGTVLNAGQAKKVLKKSRQKAHGWLLKVDPKTQELPDKVMQGGGWRGCGGQKKKGKKGSRKKQKKKKTGGDIPWSLTVTNVKDMFLLTEEDLEESQIHIQETINPKSALFAPMRLCDTAQVVKCAYQKYGGPEGYLQMALAAKRRTTAKKPKLIKQPLSVLTQTEQTQIEGSEGDVAGMEMVPDYIIPGMEDYDATSQTFLQNKFHFLMQFTAYPLLRDERLSMKLWMGRFETMEQVKQFPFLPNILHSELTSYQAGASTVASKKGTQNHQLPAFTTLLNTPQLQSQDGQSRTRAQQFFQQGIPNRAECDLLRQFLQQPSKQLEAFPYLFLYEWTPHTMVGQGDAVFGNSEGGLVVVEAKAKTATAHVTRQSKFYQQRLREAYPQAAVSAAILTNNGFEWIDQQPVKSAHVKVQENDESRDESVAVEGAGPNEDTTEKAKKEEDPVLSLQQQVEFALLAPSRMDQLECMVVDREIKPLLRFYGLKLSGNKSELVERIYQHELSHSIAGGF